MRCHYCDEQADIAVEKEELKVGLCEEHFQERLEELREDGFLDELQDELDIDGS
jgi:hypothetical protein